jgi:hypothetical protein
MVKNQKMVSQSICNKIAKELERQLNEELHRQLNKPKPLNGLQKMKARLKRNKNGKKSKNVV